MNIKSRTKKLLKQNNIWKEYKDKFPDYQMRYIASIIAEHKNPDVTDKELLELEKSVLKKEDDKMYDQVCRKLLNQKGVDWRSLSYFLFYTYQTSTFYRDRSINKENIFILNDPYELNIHKKVYWNNFVLTMDDNVLIRKILKRIK